MARFVINLSLLGEINLQKEIIYQKVFNMQPTHWQFESWRV
ncbi:Uncharacterized protein YR821_3379 [Yersinia ruckeri]|uniref:Uncharacterized protein n=1 Tax=Yersinia ruckeri TaxID=29486 RepID=A0A0A8VLI9_YERRU|nr:Uncharacterized protein YR821_3379 [Yersinia ruckeri]CEK29208.1 hypothetical protein CSF007_17560 [Yersinia ruckeri]